MAFSLSELLNPAPKSTLASPGADEMAQDDARPALSTDEYFAPELFQNNENHPTASEEPGLSAGTAPKEDVSSSGPETTVGSKGAIEVEGSLVSGAHIKSEGTVLPQENDASVKFGLAQTTDAVGIMRRYTSESLGGRMSQDSDAADAEEQGHNVSSSSVKVHGKSTSPPKSRLQKSSTKNEGQHTDKRYLCYMCNKLFTRRRSVRDHLSKIHNTKTWEPTRSLEIIVDPATGEPLEPLEAQLYKVAAKPPAINEEDEENDESELPPHESPAPPIVAANPRSGVPPTESSIAGSRASSVDNFTTPVPVIGKKRPAPASASTKKGMARQKNTHTPNKKPKLSKSENLAETPTSFRSSSAAPASVQLKAPPSKLKLQSSANSADSPTPPTSSRAASIEVGDSSANEEDEPENDVPYSAADTPNTNSDGEVFCICRKGDNHTWMIACDGGCDEWYHGKCVDIRERDGDLIDKYICPSCNLKGVGQTTWKRMCRRKGCRKPARVLHDPPSKYCSADCGRKFFVEMVVKGDESCGVSKNGQFLEETLKDKKLRKKRIGRYARKVDGIHGGGINGYPDRQHTPGSDEDERSEYETDSSADDDMLPNRGGALRAGEVRAIVDQCKTIDSWRELGRKPVAPPVINHLSGTTDEDGENGMKVEIDVQLDDFEKVQVVKLTAELAKCQQEAGTLEAKEKLLDMIKDRSGKITEEVRKTNPKMKDLCGFDPRLSWTEAEFHSWRTSEDGASALTSGKLGPPEMLSRRGEKGKVMSNGVDAATSHSDDDEEEDNMPKKGGICIKNRCARHGKWAKMQLAEVRFEQDIISRKMERLRREEESLKGRAVVRMWEMQR